MPSARLEALRGKGQLMLSYHNYEGTPSPESVVRRMLRIPADGYKIVTTARKPSDNSRVLALTKSHPRTPLMVLAMGETGFPTRVLSTAWGGMFTYAAPNASEGTAAGQVSARLLRHSTASRNSRAPPRSMASLPIRCATPFLRPCTTAPFKRIGGCRVSAVSGARPRS